MGVTPSAQFSITLRIELATGRPGLAAEVAKAISDQGASISSMEVVEAARSLGAIGATISGAGPSVLVWTGWQETGAVVGAVREMCAEWAEVERVGFSPLGADVPEL